MGLLSPAQMKKALWVVPAVTAVGLAMLGLSHVPFERVGWQTPPPPASTPLKPDDVKPVQPPLPKGWWQSGVPGVLVGICTQVTPECTAATESVGGPALVVKVWCKDNPCRNIYIRANQVTKGGAVMGWTNAVGSAEQGQVAYLSLRYYTEEDVFAPAEVTEFTIDGQTASLF